MRAGGMFAPPGTATKLLTMPLYRNWMIKRDGIRPFVGPGIGARPKQSGFAPLRSGSSSAPREPRSRGG